MNSDTVSIMSPSKLCHNPHTSHTGTAVLPPSGAILAAPGPATLMARVPVFEKRRSGFTKPIRGPSFTKPMRGPSQQGQLEARASKAIERPEPARPMRGPSQQGH